MYDDTQSHGRIPIVLDSWQSINKCLAKCSYRRRIKRNARRWGKEVDLLKKGQENMVETLCGGGAFAKKHGRDIFQTQNRFLNWCKYSFVRIYLY